MRHLQLIEAMLLAQPFRRNGELLAKSPCECFMRVIACIESNRQNIWSAMGKCICRPTEPPSTQIFYDAKTGRTAESMSEMRARNATGMSNIIQAQRAIHVAFNDPQGFVCNQRSHSIAVKRD